jgi:methyl-accepting chemotaxis protein
MFNKLTIRSKLTALALVATIVIAALGGGTFLLQSSLARQTPLAIENGRNSTALVANARVAHVNFQRQVQEWKNILIRGNDKALFDKHMKAFRERADEVQKNLAKTEQQMSAIGMAPGAAGQVRKDHEVMLKKYLDALATFDSQDPESGKKVDVLVRGVDRATSSNFDKLIDAILIASNKNMAEQEVNAKASTANALLGTFFGMMVTLLLFVAAFVVLRRVDADIQSLNSLAEQLNAGDLNARATVRENSQDELSHLGGALNQLLDQRINSLQIASDENEHVNNSVIEIMTAVAQLAQRDLNVKVPVSEDITGAVSDAINMMTSSTARAMREVNTISAQVSDSSGRVRQRADAVYKLADEASNQANAASAELTTTANSLQQIGEQAQGAGRDAERALAKTSEALAVVRETVSGISISRDQIRETEKRVKRLAERSQEISSAVSIIGKISERTSVLALNASMQAVAAGEAGRGFAAVADEVKRLAENAREATQQIAGLVSAIQSDTTETLQSMNSTIAQVVDITRLADNAGTQMNDTREATEALANSVRLISQATQTQAEASQRLLARAYELINASQRTLEEIEQQRGDTENLSESASALVRTVSEFRLPA